MTETTTSPERQEEALDAYCLSKGWQIVARHSDLDLSAYSGVARPGLDGLMSRLADVDVVVVYRLDRLARGQRHFWRLKGELEDAGVQLVSTSEGIDTSTPGGKVMLAVIASLAEVESDTISARVTAAQEHLHTEGFFTGGKVPKGWKVDRSSGHSRLVLDHEAAAPYLKAIGRILAGESLNSTADEMGVYYQVLVLRLRSRRLVGQLVRKGRVVTDADGVPVRHCEPMIDMATFQQLQVALDARTPRGGRTQARSGLLSTMLTCSLCGKRMVKGEPSYRCPAQHNNIRIFKADAIVESAFLAENGDEQIIEEITIPGNEAQRRELTEALDRLDDDRADGVIEGDRYKRQVERIQARLDALPATTGGVELRATGRCFAQTWAQADLTERRALLSSCIESITVSPATKRGPGSFDPSRIVLRWREVVAWEVSDVSYTPSSASSCSAQ
jgi:site-specific DNA recombinase